MERYIQATVEDKKFLARAFGVTPMSISRALSYKRNEGKAGKIRKLALERGAIRMCAAPEIETIHDAEGIMRQYFPNGAVIECDKRTGDAKILYNKKVFMTMKNITVRQLGTMQNLAMAIKD